MIRTIVCNSVAAALTVTLAIAVGYSPASATPLTNLDFEQATVVVNDPVYGNLDWNLALPGWSALAGTPTLYYGSGHLGMSPFTMLVDGASTLSSWRIAGGYSVLVKRGHEEAFGDAGIRQTGDIPAGAKAIEFSSRGAKPLLYVDGQLIELVEVGQSGAIAHYAGNIDPFAGSTAEIAFHFSSFNWWEHDDENEPFIYEFGSLDDIQLTARIVPEPASIALAIAAAAGSVLLGRRSRAKRSD